MGLNSININNVNLDDDNFDDYNNETINIRPMAWNNRFKQQDDMQQELEVVPCHKMKKRSRMIFF